MTHVLQFLCMSKSSCHVSWWFSAHMATGRTARRKEQLCLLNYICLNVSLAWENHLTQCIWRALSVPTNNTVQKAGGDVWGENNTVNMCVCVRYRTGSVVTRDCLGTSIRIASDFQWHSKIQKDRDRESHGDILQMSFAHECAALKKLHFNC